MKELAQHRPKVGGRRGALTIFDLAARKLRQRASDGELKALDYLNAWRGIDEAERTDTGVMFLPEVMTEEDWERSFRVMEEADRILARRRADRAARCEAKT